MLTGVVADDTAVYSERRVDDGTYREYRYENLAHVFTLNRFDLVGRYAYVEIQSSNSSYTSLSQLEFYEEGPRMPATLLLPVDEYPMYLHMDASRATTVSGSTTLAAGGVVDQVSDTAFSYYGTTPVLHENGGIRMNGGHLYLDFGDYSTKIGNPATTGMNTTVMCVVQHLGNSSWQTMFNWSAPKNAPHLNIMRMGDSGSATYQEMTVNDFNRASGTVATTKYNSNGDLETRIYVGTVEHNVNAAAPNSFDQTVTLRVYDDTGQSVFDGQSDSRTIAYSSISSLFASTSRYVHLGGYANDVHSPNLTMKELKWFQNKLSPVEEAAQVSALAAKWGPQPAGAAIERALVSEADASNSSLTVSEAGITNIFDYDSTQITSAGSYPKELNRFVLNNGDSFYCPSDDSTLVAGKLFDNNLDGAVNIQFRPNEYDSSLTYTRVYRFYYEPYSDIYVNKLTIYAGNGSNGEYLQDLFVVNGATSTSVTGLSTSLPKSLPAGSSRMVTFDPVVIGPGKPLRIRINEVNARAYLTEIILEYTL